MTVTSGIHYQSDPTLLYLNRLQHDLIQITKDGKNKAGKKH